MRKIKNKGFSYFADFEDIKAYMRVPYKRRLEFLEEANLFTRKVLSQKKLKIWGKFRKGEI